MLSIVTINKDNFDGLKKTACSLECQTNKDFQWVIIDGCSTDGSADYIRNLRLNPFSADLVTIIESDSGIYNAMNKGLQLSSQTYVMFLNSGDELMGPKTIRDILLDLKKQDFPDVLVGGTVVKGRARRLFRKPGPINWRGMPGFHQSMVFKRSIHGVFDESLRLAGDFKKYLNLLEAGAKFKLSDRYFSIFDYNGRSSDNPLKSLDEAVAVMSEYGVSKINHFSRFSHAFKVRLIRYYLNGVVSRRRIEK